MTLLLWHIPVMARGGQDPFVTPLSIEQMRNKQVLVETTEGMVVIDLLPDVAPNHVGLIMEHVADGGFDGTSFHGMVLRGIIQGGDPFSKDPDRRDEYGRGGLGLVAVEPSDERHTVGTVSAVGVPGDPNSDGLQFLITVVAQPGLDGHHTIWGRVVEGLPVVTRISETAVDADGKAIERVEIVAATIRDWAPPPPPPFTTETVDELAAYRAARAGLGAAVLPCYLAEADPQLVRHGPPIAELATDCWLLMHPTQRAAPLVTLFSKTIGVQLADALASAPAASD